MILEKKTVLVTGGAGFIGHHLCSALLSRGYKVLCLDNFSSGTPQNISHLKGHRAFGLIRHDIAKPISIRGKIHSIYNLASPASPVDYQRRPLDTLRANTLGIFNVAFLALKKRADLFQASTSEIYGDPLVHPQIERYFGNVNHLGWRGCYEEGKRVAETILFTFYQTQNLKLQIVRIFNTYGPGMRANDGRVIPSFIVAAKHNKPIRIYGGSQTRSFCYVDDLVLGLLRLQNLKQYAGPINLGNPEEATMSELASKILLMTNSKSKITTLPSQLDDPKKRRPNIDKAKKLLHWIPKIPLEKGLQSTLDGLITSS